MTVDSGLQPRHRPLTAAETRLLHARMVSLGRRGRRAASAGLWVGAAAIVVLWALTMFLSDAPTLVITGFWLAAGLVIVLWTQRDFGRDRKVFDALAAALDSAVRRNMAEVYDIRSTAFVQFEEVEDEGACYAFQLQGRDAIVFLSGQQFYEEARFPSLDFSLVFPLDEAGRSVDMLIEKRGPKAASERVIPASVKDGLTIPGDLEIVSGTLDGIEKRLRPRR